MKKSTIKSAISFVTSFTIGLVVVMVIITLATLNACGVADDYKYADHWETSDIQATEAIDYVKKYAKNTVSEDDLKTLEAAKELVKENIAHPEILDWDKFNQLQTVKQLDLKVEDIDNMSYEEIYIYQHYLAFYDGDSDSMYILPQFYMADNDHKIYVFVHEIIHSLVDNRDDIDDGRLVEGMVDWLAARVCNDCGITVTPAYQEAILCLRMLTDIYGEEQVLQAICEDRIVGLIDGSTKPGMSEKLTYALAVAHDDTNSTYVIREAIYAELDILAHAAKHEGVDFGDWLDAITAIYHANGIELDIDYFKRI